MSSLVALLRRQALERPERGYTYLAQGEDAAACLSYAELDQRARAIAAALSGAVPPGERALLIYPPGLEFVSAFFGCLYAGVIAVPAYPPHSRRPDPRLRSIAADCRPRAVLTTASLLVRREALAGQAPELAPAVWLDTETLREDGRDAGFTPRPEDLAFLQYTSGSTGTPKGVMVRHANLLHNLERIRCAFGQTSESVVVGWLPLFHDMGLIGNVLQPCYVGADCVLMPPAAFLQKPVRWLQAIQRFRGTTSGGPDFSYDLCVRGISPEARAGLDLSSWNVAFNGAEPVRRATLERFAEAFAPSGFRRAAFAPCYGLAEATLLVTAARGVSDGPGVSCGDLPPGEEVRVVDPESGNACAGGEVGEIWISGPSVAAGYWNRPAETRETFGAVAGDGGGPFLRTGDLGFVRQGELFIAGRLKDLIILRGRNHYPQDLELTAEQSHPALRPGGGAAFSVDAEGEERLVVVSELERRFHLQSSDLAAIAEAIRRAMADEHGVQVSDVVLLRTGTIPKTSSGKIRRGECRALYLAGGLAVLHRSSTTPAGAGRLLTRLDLLALDPPERPAVLAAWLGEEIARRAGGAPQRLDPETTLAAAGLDSLALFDLQARLEADLGLAPPGASLADLSIAELRDHLLEHLAATPEEGLSDLPPLVSGEVLGLHPLSPGQEALWFLESSASTEGVFHLAAAARLGAEADCAALLRAARALPARHPVLRTTFVPLQDGESEPGQRVHASLPQDLEEVDATAWGAEELDEALRREARRRLDLEQGSPLRIRVFLRPGGERILLLVLHHLAGDFWSLAVLLRDWAALYARERDPLRPPLLDLPAAYSDFVRWQRALLAGTAGERLERYWLDRLDGAPLTLDLPADRPRPRTALHAGALLDLRLDSGVSGGVRELARAHGTSLFVALLTAFQVLLGRLTSQDDLLVGSPTTGRRDRDLDGVVGYFVNPLVLRAELTGDPPFSVLLARNRQAVAEALDHRDLPFPQLARRLQPARDPGRPPVFQVLFVLQQATPSQEPGLAAFAVGQAGVRVELDGLALESLRLDRGTSQLDLTLSAAEVGDSLVLSCEYDTALFDGVTVARWLGHLQVLLAAAAAPPELRLGDLPFLTRAEQHQLLREWSDTGAMPEPGACLHELFEAQARRTPEAVAVIDGVREVLYRELDQAADRLARRLSRAGAGPEVVIGVCLERSADMLAALLAILKTGACYLPLDPQLPGPRLAGMLASARASAVVSDPRLAARLPWSGQVILVSGGSEDADPSRRRWRADPENLAYVLYTSGSTGTPKGVAVTHRSAVELVRWAGTVYAPEELAGVLAATSLSFDLSVFELFVPLSWGGTVVLARNALELPALPAAGRVTLINTVPSAVSELVHAGGLGASVRTVNLAGEPLHRSLADRIYATGTVECVWNLYGPSEDTTYSTFSRVARESSEAPGIGRPVAATKACVLVRQVPAPLGVPGELHLGGAGLARGYLHRPDWTAERFLPDPFATEPGARLYRTGDLVRWTAGGELEFLGRIDHQVKVRGFRIELGEIEAALVASDGVREAVVVAREDAPGERRLVAYVAGDATAGALRRSLRERLPDFMVPSAFVSLDALPLTPHGKVDRKALPAPEQARSAEGLPAPRTPVEEVLAGIWAELLGLERVGVADDFFALGGHSLLATRVVSRLRAVFGVEMPLRDLLDAPVLSELAARVERALRAGSGPSAPPLVPRDPGPEGGALPLSFAQQRLWFIDQLEPGSPLYNMPVALRFRGPLDTAVLGLCLTEIVRRHEVLRTVFAVREGSPVQVILPAARFGLAVVDLSGLPESGREARGLALAGEEARRAFDLGRGPLLRCVVLRLGEPDHLVALTVHHIVSDGWSMGILVREITALYAAFAAGGTSPLPELPVQYADFSVWQRSWLAGEVLESEMSFWRRQLAGLPPLLELATDRPRPAMQSFRGASRHLRLPAGLGRQVQALGRREGATLFMVLLAAFESLLARSSGQEDLAVGTPIAGRNRMETEGLIGFFVNTLVLRGDLSGDPSFRELVGRVRETALAAHTHQDVPFEKLVQELAPERSLAHTPLFQVMFALQNLPSAGIDLAGLSISPVAQETVTAKLDLELGFTEERDGLSARLDFAVDLFDGSTVQRLTGHLAALLEGALADPERRLRDLPLLSAGERHQLRSEWNDTSVAGAPGVVELFEAQVQVSPEAVAVVLAGESGPGLTYGELDRRASLLAGRLRALGVGPGVAVGVCVEQTPDLLVALLGVLKSGGGYLPLDPAHPRARLGFLLADAAVAVLVTQEHLLPSLPPHGAETVLVEEAGQENDVRREGRTRRPAPGDLAYLIYTSGTTGRPKAVQVEHGMLASTLAAMRDLFHFTAADRMPCLALPTFDISLFELLSPLLTGGTAVLFPLRPTLDVERLVDHLGALTCVHAVPALMRSLVDSLRRRGTPAPAGLRAVFVGGDVVASELLADLRETFPAARVWVLYGPTEGTIVCAAHPVPRPPAPARSLLGRPLAGAVLEVRDACGELLPAGVPGELWIGGTGVTRGYLGREELTAEKYVLCEGERFYRSGDRVRRLADGTLEFLGRLDNQVKLRGFRIELGEIEAALQEHPGVDQAVVLARGDGPAGQMQLVAWCAAAGSRPAAADLRSFLAERLPAYMVPAVFMTLPELPLSPNGKVDRNALPAPDATRPGMAREYVAPRTSEEERLAAVWAQVLRLPRVGVNDNFFELGGDSILSIQIVSRARQAGLLLTVRQVFEHQTVAELARHATAADPSAARSGQGPVVGEVPLTPIQRGFFEHGFADLHHFNQALLLETAEPLLPAALERAMAAVVEHHDALRMRFERQGEGGGWWQENAGVGPDVPFHRIDLSALPVSGRREALESAAATLQTGFDLAAGPLTRLVLFEAGAESPGLLLWAIHHLVVDGVSWRVLLEDLEGAYRQAVRGLGPAFPPKTTSFRDWARHLAAHAVSDVPARELEHWLAEARIPVPRLPVDFPAGENTVGAEASVSIELTAEETSDLLRAVPAVYHNRIDEALLSALARALASWTGSPRLRVDLEGHGREPVFEEADGLDTSRTVGWFTTVYPVVLEAGDADPGTALVSAKERLRAVPGRGLGYGLLRHPSDGGKGGAGLLAAAPAAEISFNYLGQLDAASGEPSLFRPSIASVGPTRSPRAHRTHLLDVGGMVVGGRLRITLAYGSRVHRRATAERLAAAYAAALRQLIRQSRDSAEEVFSPADFPRARLDANGLEKLAASFPLKDVEDVYPLSPLQNGMLFHSLMAPESGVYVSQVTCTLSPDLDSRRFRQAWKRVVQRHGALRTAFWEGLDEPLQVVRKSFSLPWQDLDWSGLPVDEQQRRFEELRQRDRHTPLALGEVPLMRFSLIRLDGELGFIWTFHHLLMDGWSLPLVVGELGTIYTALREDREPALLPIRPFSEYIAWLQKQDLARAESFWRRELAGFAAPTPLDIVHRSGSAEEGAGSAEHEIRVSRETTAGLQALAARHKLTLQTVTLGAWAVLLNRYSSAEDVVFGSVVSGRPAALPGVEAMVGLFINTLPVRVQVGDAEPLVPWLEHLQERQLVRSELESSPLLQIKRWSEVPSDSPLFETLYVFENYPSGEGGGPGGLRVGNLRSFETTNYPVTLILASGDQIPLRLMYDRSRFEEAAASRLLRHLATLLSAMAGGPERRLGELDLLTPEEALQIRAWKQPATRHPLDRPFHAWIEDHAARAPGAVAVTFEGRDLTYGELDGRANRLARHLRTLGVGPEVRVAVLMERSAELVVALLAVLRAGGAFVPLDPAYPVERLAFLLADSAASVLMTDTEPAEALAASPCRIVRLDADRDRIEALPATRLASPHEPASLAYVIYTSGSTGRPKGVQIPYGNVTRLFAATEAWFGFGERDVWTLFHSYAFDFSVWEIWGALRYGGRLVVVPHEVSRSPALFLDLLIRERVTVLNQTPSAFAQLANVDEERAGASTDLRVVIFGGEALDPASLAPWFARHGDAKPLLVNMYGITETTVHVTYRPLHARDARDTRRSVIGVPIHDLSLSVMDPWLRPAPIGVPGELVIGGEGLARGYLGRPELTAERFVPDPESDRPGARLYRSGDLGRFLSHNELEYLGRTDHQVKIRGFRIELGEIEALLMTLAGVREAVVVAREDTPGDRRLVAYVVGDVQADRLRRSLRERLPDYMVPAAFVNLAALPLTPNGKMDRKALPAPGRDDAARGSSVVAPRDPLELSLALAWEDLLGTRSIGVTDSFFDLGGDSLLAVSLMARIRRQLGRELPLSVLFEHPTIEHLAARLRRQPGRSELSALVSFHPSARPSAEPPLVFVHPIGGQVFCYLDLARRLGPDQPFQALQAVPGRNGARPLSLEGLARTYLEEMQAVWPNGPYRLGGWSMGGVVAYEMARQLERQGQSVELLALIDAVVPEKRSQEGDGPTAEQRLLLEFFRDLVGLAGRNLTLPLAELQALPAEKSLRRGLEEARRAGALPAGFEVSDIQEHLAVFAANRAALESYVPGPYSGRLTLFRCENGGRSADLGWGRHAKRLEVESIPGGHYTALREPHVGTLERLLTARLQKQA